MEAANPKSETMDERLSPRQAPKTDAEGQTHKDQKLTSPKRVWTGLTSRSLSREGVLFVLAIGIYLGVRLIGLIDFPIYFFTDEAVQTVSAASLVENDFRDPLDGTLLPTYFKNGSYYNLSTSVYLQLAPYLLWGPSVFTTRAVSVLISLLAALSISVILKYIFKIKYWWSGPLLLSAAPAWFLHSRTAFETVIFASFYAAALAFYLLYRYRSPSFLYPTVAMAALAFYTYSPGQVIIAATTLLLMISDLGYHWKNRWIVINAGLLLGLLALPYLRFRLAHNAAPLDHLRRLGSYWIQPIPLTEKLAKFGQNYLFGLSPGYWFIPHDHDLERHLMKGYGHLLRATLPLAALGAGWSLWNYRSPAHRAILLAALAAPAGSAMVGIGITRVLVMVIPASLFMSLGLSKGVEWMGGFIAWLRERRKAELFASLFSAPTSAALLPWVIFGVLGIANIRLLTDALVNGPTWFQNYGLGGMQYGASQLFPAVQEYLDQHPQADIIVSPTWTNGTDVVARFFMGDPLPIQLGSIQGYIDRKQSLGENTLFVMTPEELEGAEASHKFRDIQIYQTIPFPNGKPGFYFVHLRYVENIDEILRAESQARRVLQEEIISIDGQDVRVRYSLLDMGEIGNIFDGDPNTVARTLEANPMVLELTFPEIRRIEGYSIIIGSMQPRITAQLMTSAGASPVENTSELKGSVDQPKVSVTFQAPSEAQILRLEILDPHQPEPGNIHVWELELR